VATWSGSGTTTISLTAPTAAERPTFNTAGVNGLGDYVTFDGIDDNLRVTVDASSFLPNAQSTTIMVLRPSDTASESITAWGNTIANMWQLSLNPDIHYVQGSIASPANMQVTAPVPSDWAGTWRVITGIRNADGSGEIRLNGGTVGTVPAGTFTGPVSGSGALVIGGSDFGAGDRWAGDIAEVRVYSTVPTIATEEAALFTAYNITPVPEPSEYAMIFGLACVAGAVALRYRRQQLAS
jgi:hypothetical protein